MSADDKFTKDMRLVIHDAAEIGVHATPTAVGVADVVETVTGNVELVPITNEAGTIVETVSAGILATENKQQIDKDIKMTDTTTPTSTTSTTQPTFVANVEEGFAHFQQALESLIKGLAHFGVTAVPTLNTVADVVESASGNSDLVSETDKISKTVESTSAVVDKVIPDAPAAPVVPSTPSV